MSLKISANCQHVWLVKEKQKRKAKETEAQKDEGTSPRSPKRPVIEPENKSVRIQSWFLGPSVPSGKQFCSLLPPPRLSAKLRTLTGHPCQGVNLSTNKGSPKTCSGLPTTDRDSWTSVLALWVNVEKLDVGVQNFILKVTNSEHPLGLRGAAAVMQQPEACNRRTTASTISSLEESQIDANFPVQLGICSTGNLLLGPLVPSILQAEPLRGMPQPNHLSCVQGLGHFRNMEKTQFFPSTKWASHNLSWPMNTSVHAIHFLHPPPQPFQ